MIFDPARVWDEDTGACLETIQGLLAVFKSVAGLNRPSVH